jgi:hypothetical protein
LVLGGLCGHIFSSSALFCVALFGRPTIRSEKRWTGETRSATEERLMKIISGGQTGVDRAALDAGLELGMEIGGWCPKNRWAEDGPIPPRYPLYETRSEDVAVRTQRNVESSTATLVLTRGSPMGGTRLTCEIAQSMRRPLLIVDLLDTENDPVDSIVDWLEKEKPRVLNVAGPRESGAPGISEQSKTILRLAFELVQGNLQHVEREDTPAPMVFPVSESSSDFLAV